MTFGESLVFLVALLSGILDSIGGGAGGHGDNLGTSSIGISALNQYCRQDLHCRQYLYCLQYKQ